MNWNFTNIPGIIEFFNATKSLLIHLIGRSQTIDLLFTSHLLLFKHTNSFIILFTLARGNVNSSSSPLGFGHKSSSSESIISV